MLHIVLCLLKILGCILLILLGLILLILCIVLFTPIKYDISGAYYGLPDVSAKITWLFGIFKASVSYSHKQLCIRGSVLKKVLYDSGKEEYSKEKKSDDSEEYLDLPTGDEMLSDDELSQNGSDVSKVIVRTKQPVTDVPTDPNIHNELNSKKDPKEADTKTSAKKTSVSAKNISEHNHEEAVSDEIQRISQAETIFDRIDSLIEKIEQKFETVINNIDSKIGQITCKWNKIERFVRAECTQKSILLIKKMLLSVLNHIKPKKVSGKIHFGFHKPSSTGKILGYASAFYPLYAHSIQLEPDFENEIIEGDLKMRGSIQLYIFVVWVIRALLSKDIRKLIKYIKHLKK